MFNTSGSVKDPIKFISCDLSDFSFQNRRKNPRLKSDSNKLLGKYFWYALRMKNGFLCIVMNTGIRCVKIN